MNGEKGILFIKWVFLVFGSWDSCLYEFVIFFVFIMVILLSFIVSNGGYWEKIKFGYFCFFMVL